MNSFQLRTTKLLMSIGVNPGLLGYKYIGKALEKAYEDDNILHSMTKELYPFVARAYDSTPSRVERAIRHAIEQAFDRMHADTVDKYFGSVVEFDSGKVTNTTFLACLVEHLRMEELEEKQ